MYGITLMWSFILSNMANFVEQDELKELSRPGTGDMKARADDLKSAREEKRQKACFMFPLTLLFLFSSLI